MSHDANLWIHVRAGDAAPSEDHFPTPFSTLEAAVLASRYFLSILSHQFHMMLFLVTQYNFRLKMQMRAVVHQIHHVAFFAVACTASTDQGCVVMNPIGYTSCACQITVLRTAISWLFCLRRSQEHTI